MSMAEAQDALRAIAFDLIRIEEPCQEVLDSLPQTNNEAPMFEYRTSWEGDGRTT